MNIQSSSQEAFNEVKLHIYSMQDKVYYAIKELGSATNLMIAKFLNVPINSVTGRCYELRCKRLVVFDKEDIDHNTGRKSIFWRIK